MCCETGSPTETAYGWWCDECLRGGRYVPERHLAEANASRHNRRLHGGIIAQQSAEHGQEESQ
jgi:hypothetical protein